MSDLVGALKDISQALRASPFLRLVAMGGLTLILLIPIEWISSLITERMVRRGQAVTEVAEKWGGVQTIIGPALVVPYVHRWSERDDRGKVVWKNEPRELTVLPADLRVSARVASEELYRGIFAIPVYRVVLDVAGEFQMPDLAGLGIDATLVEWNRSVVGVGISDARNIQNRAVLSWNGETFPFLPGPCRFEVDSGIHAPIDRPFATARPSFALQLAVNGSAGLSFTPSGQETTVEVEGNWPSPSFRGSWLPAKRLVRRDGFNATWEIPFLGRNQASVWTSEASGVIERLAAASFGVDFIAPVDAHRMADRSVKYARLFVVLTFGTIWLIEVLSAVRIHPIQYLLIGCALCAFYLLELSLSEQIGFALAYCLAGTAVATLVGLYSAAVLHRWNRALSVAATIGGLYIFLFVLLTNEDYALLLGSLGIFVAVAVSMLATRRIDWYAAAGAGRQANARGTSAPSCPESS